MRRREARAAAALSSRRLAARRLDAVRREAHLEVAAAARSGRPPPRARSAGRGRRRRRGSGCRRRARRPVERLGLRSGRPSTQAQALSTTCGKTRSGGAAISIVCSFRCSGRSVRSLRPARGASPRPRPCPPRGSGGASPRTRPRAAGPASGAAGGGGGPRAGGGGAREAARRLLDGSAAEAARASGLGGLGLAWASASFSRSSPLPGLRRGAAGAGPKARPPVPTSGGRGDEKRADSDAAFRFTRHSSMTKRRGASGCARYTRTTSCLVRRRRFPSGAPTARPLQTVGRRNREL